MPNSTVKSNSVLKGRVWLQPGKLNTEMGLLFFCVFFFPSTNNGEAFAYKPQRNNYALQHSEPSRFNSPWQLEEEKSSRRWGREQFVIIQENRKRSDYLNVFLAISLFIKASLPWQGIEWLYFWVLSDMGHLFNLQRLIMTMFTEVDTFSL